MHEELNGSDASAMNRAAIFLQLLEINKKVEQVFDQSEVGFGGNGFEMPPLPSQPGGNKENLAHPSGNYGNREQFGKFRDKIMGLDQREHVRKFMDMNDVVDMHSDKDLPNFMHKLNLKLNLYEPDLRFATINKKW